MADNVYTSPIAKSPDDNPYSAAGLRRRNVTGASPVFDNTVVDKRDWVEKAIDSSALNFQAGLVATEGLVRRVVGDMEGSDAQLLEAANLQQQAREVGPEIQTLDDARAAGGELGDYAAWAGAELVNLVPDMAASLTGAGVGGAIARRTAATAVKALARRTAAEIAEGRGVAAAADAASSRLLREAAGAAAQTGRAAAAERLGGALGAAAGELPGITGESVQALQNTDQAGALKIAAANFVAALVGGLPEVRAVGRIGGQLAEDTLSKTAQRYATRIAKETGVQAGSEGMAEVAQQAIQLAGHKWAGENIDLVGDDAVDQYIASFFGGAVLGGILGGGIETGRIGAEVGGKAAKAVSDTARQAATQAKQGVAALKRHIRENVALAAKKVRETAKSATTPPSGDPPVRSTVSDDLRAEFQANQQRVFEDDAIDDEADRLYNDLVGRITAEQVNMLRDAPRDRVTDLGLKTPGERLAASIVPDNHAMWSEYDQDGLRRVFKSVDKLLRGKELNADDQARVDVMRISFPERMAMLQAIAPQYSEDAGVVERIGDDELTVDDLAQLNTEAASEPGVLGTDTQIDGDPANQNTAVEQLLSARQSGEVPAELEAAANAEVFGRPILGNEAAERYGSKNKARQYGSNVTVVNRTRPKSVLEFNKRKKDPSYVQPTDTIGVLSVDGEPVTNKAGEQLQADYLIDIGGIAIQQRGRNPGITGEDAVMRAFSDVLALGVEINPDTITPGVIKDKDGNRVATITPAMVGEMRTAVRQYKAEESLPQRPQRLGPFQSADASGVAVEEQTGDFIQQAEFGEPDTRLIAREPPPGTAAKNSQQSATSDVEGFVPTQSPVTEVNISRNGDVSIRNAPDDSAVAAKVGDADYADVDAAPEAKSFVATKATVIDALNENPKRKHLLYRPLSGLGVVTRLRSAAAAVHSAFGVDPKRQVFNGFALMSRRKAEDGTPVKGGQEPSATTSSNTNGDIVLSLNASKMSLPDNVRGDETLADKYARVYAHELMHAIDAAYAFSDGSRLSEDKAFDADGYVWDEVRAAVAKDRLMKSWFGYLLDPKPGVKANRELLSQLAALKVRFPESLNEHFPEGGAILEAALEKYRASVDGRAAEARSSVQETPGSEGAAAENADAENKSRDGLTDAVSKAVGKELDDRQAKNAVASAVAVSAVADASAPNDTNLRSLRSLMKFVRDVMPTDARKVLDRVLNREDVDSLMRAHYADSPGALKLLDSGKYGLEGRIALAYFMWRDGILKAGPGGAAAFRTTVEDTATALFNVTTDSDYAERIFDDITSGQIEAAKAAGTKYDVRALARRSNSVLQKTYEFFKDVGAKIEEPLSKMLTSSQERMRSWGVPAARELVSMLRKGQGTVGRDRGMYYEITHETAKFMRTAERAFNKLQSADQLKVLRALQSQSTGTLTGDNATAAAALLELMNKVADHMQEAGVVVNRVPDYWPVQVNIRDENAKQRLTTLLSDPQFEADIRSKMNAKPSDDIKVLIGRMVEAATKDGLSLAPTEAGTPAFEALNHRFMDFIYSKGTDAQKKEFAELQVSDPYEAVASYVEPAIRRAAYARRFGDDGAKLERVLGRMKTQGATDAQVREARNVVAATLGSYGHEYSPTIAMLSESLAKKVAGRDSQATIQGLQAYQNVRLLPLATLSSIIDPLGIAVRTGGDMKTAWEGMKLGLRTLFDGSTKADMLDALSMLGATDEMSTLAAGFGGGTTPLTRKVNDFVFRLNGLAGWTRATRFMALHAGHQFLIKHATKPNKHSQRYLDELGIKAGDIETETLYLPNGRSREAVKLFTGNKARDTRVQHALSQFIDEAILRPGSTQRPLWHSDPYMGLVSQYKGFAYAIWDQVGGRIAREWSKGNVAILMPALLYAPITIMVELMRELIQHGPEGDARRKDWGPDDYLLMGVDRSNVFFSPRDRAIAQSINDVKNNRVFGSSQIGPTISQARDIYSAASAQRSAGKTFEDALPASPLWKRWNDDGIADNVPAVAAANLVKENV